MTEPNPSAASKLESTENPMVVADPLAVFQKEAMFKVVAPAKTNLLLAVGPQREDGFHEATTIMHALSLHDVLHVDYLPESSGGLVVEAACYERENITPSRIASDENLAVQAIVKLADKLARNEDETIRIRIEKHIPYQAGLGGGSSDAAAALVAAAKLWEIDPLSPQVIETAEEIGTDVAFFLYGGCICLTGKGERYSHKLEPMKQALVIIKPEEGVSTAAAYRAFDRNPVAIPQAIIDQAMNTTSAEQVPLFNNLTEAAEEVLPKLAEIKEWAQVQSGVQGVILSGSGSAIIAVCDTFDSACKISSEARKQGLWTRAANFTSLKAAVIPK